MNIVFQVKGGLGKVIASTAVIKGFNRKYPTSKIIVICSYPDVYANNPFVDQVYGFDQLPGLYDRHLKDGKFKLYLQDPYEHPEHFHKKTHIIETWFKLCDLEYANETPQIYLTGAETDYYSRSYSSSPKPIFALHCNGGPQEQNSQYSWPRDIPVTTLEEIINHYKNDYTICHIKQPWQANYQDTMPMMDNWRGVAVLLQMAEKRLFIDSFTQHLAAAVNVPSTVCWVTTKPEVFGYDIHDNILAEPHTKDPDYSRAIYHDFDFMENLDTLPYWSMPEIFDNQKIIKSLDK